MIATSRAAMLRAAMSTASGSGGEICCSVGAASVPLAGCLISGARRRNRNVAALRARIRRRFSHSGGESGRSLRLVREVSSPQLYHSTSGIHVRRYIVRLVHVLLLLLRLCDGICRGATMPGLGVSVCCGGCCIVERGGEESLRVWGGQAPHTPRFFSSLFFFYKARSNVQDHAAAKKKERSSQATRARLSVRVAAAARSRPRRGRS